jgi:hypothetical protein
MYQGEYQFGQKNGMGRLETYTTAQVPPISEINHKSYKSYLKTKLLPKVKQDIDIEIAKIVRNTEDNLNATDPDLDIDIDELKRQRGRSLVQKRYVGEFKHDFKNGFGVMEYENGDIYEGQFLNDKRQGKGKYIYLSKGDSQLYYGEFKEDSMAGEGKLIFSNGDVYIGMFKNNKMHDEDAVITYKNGDQYRGGVAQNLKHGKEAEYLYSAGDKYTGDFRGDKKQGKGFIALNKGKHSYIFSTIIYL